MVVWQTIIGLGVMLVGIPAILLTFSFAGYALEWFRNNRRLTPWRRFCDDDWPLRFSYVAVGFSAVVILICVIGLILVTALGIGGLIYS